MIRTVPETTGEGIELYIRTYYSLLRSSGDIRIRSLEETHEGMKSSLHLGAESPDFDASAFLYAALRLPDCHGRTSGAWSWANRRRYLCAAGCANRDLAARGCTRPPPPHVVRRRGHLAAFVSSVSDIDDLVPCLTAFQIEWNKLHRRLVCVAAGTGSARAPCCRRRRRRAAR